MTGERPGEVFDRLAEDYAAARPTYPDALFEAIWHRLPRRWAKQPRCLDVAAGTGAVTVSLLTRGARVAAFDPAIGMLGQARARAGDRAGWLGVVAARAEALPVVGRAAHLATVAQAYHWLAESPALDELARVLYPDGVLAILWNISQADDFSDEVWSLVEEMNPGHKRPVRDEKRLTPEALAGHPAFRVEAPLEFPHTRRLSIEAYVRYAMSWSFVGGALGGAERARFSRRLRAILARHRGSEMIEERLVAVAHIARRQ